MEKPKVIFLDAVGTIFGVKGSVGEVYSQIAAEFGVTVAPEIFKSGVSQKFLQLHHLPYSSIVMWKLYLTGNLTGGMMLF